MELTLVVTRNCNLCCPYCYAGDKVSSDMDIQTAQKGMDLVFEHDDSPIKGLHFFGGEPLLNWELMVQADQYFEQHWATKVSKKSLTTNGTLLSAEKSRWLSNHGYYIGLSLDGARESHDKYRSLADGTGTFDIVFQNAQYMIQNNINFKTIMVVNPENLKRLYDDVVYLYEQGFTALSLNLNTSADWNWYTMHRLKKVYSRLSQFYIQEKVQSHKIYINVFDGKLAVLKAGGYHSKDHCQMGVKEVSLSPSGKFYPCERFVGNDDDVTVHIGTIKSGIDPRRVKQFQTPREHKECAECQYQPYCVNWCGCTNYSTTGVWDEVPGVLCRYEQMLINVAREMVGV